MKKQSFWQSNSTLLIILAALAALSVLGYTGMGEISFVRTTLSGLTLGMLYFMVAAGLTLIFGLMDILNFAHGSMFMLGAYLGWQFYTNPTFIFGVLPLVGAVLVGLSLGAPLQPWVNAWRVPARWQPLLRRGLILAGLVAVVLAVVTLDFKGLAETSMVAPVYVTNPIAEASPQEPLSTYWFRPLLLALGGLLIAISLDRPGDETVTVDRFRARRGWLVFGLILALTVGLVLVREAGPVAVLQLDGTLRFVLALVVGALGGAGIGAVIEITLIRPLYIRPFFQVILTLGLAYVILEVVQFLWSPLGYQMSRPPAFAQPGEAADLLTWLREGSVTINILGVTFPSYRLFIIFLGLFMVVALGLILRYSRLGMIIRAGVQDRQMVEALGINVRRVFTMVFMLGTGLAALGGIGAAPFIPVQPTMGDAFQLTAFITVVIGGMGSYIGAVVGALLLGLARAFGDFLSLSFNLSPSIAEASTVIIMAIVLLVRPAGLFGKKE